MNCRWNCWRANFQWRQQNIFVSMEVFLTVKRKGRHCYLSYFKTLETVKIVCKLTSNLSNNTSKAKFHHERDDNPGSRLSLQVCSSLFTLSPWDYPRLFGFLITNEKSLEFKGQTPLHCLFCILVHFWLCWSSLKKSLQGSWVRLTLAMCANVLVPQSFSHVIRPHLSRSCKLIVAFECWAF